MDVDQKVKLSPLPIRKIFREALKFPFNHTNQFWIWWSLLIIGFWGLSLSINYFEEQMSDKIQDGISLIIFDTAIWVPEGLLFSLFAVICHRIILLEEKHERWVDFFKWSHRETRFFIWSYLVYIVAIFLWFLFSSMLMILLYIFTVLFGQVIEWESLNLGENRILNLVFIIGLGSLFVLPFWYFVARIILVLPSTAIDEKPTLSWAWDLSMGNGWRLAVITGFIPLVFILGVYLNQEFLELETLIPVWLEEIIEVLLMLFLGMIEIALLSEAYKELSNENKTTSLSGKSDSPLVVAPLC